MPWPVYGGSLGKGAKDATGLAAALVQLYLMRESFTSWHGSILPSNWGPLKDTLIEGKHTDSKVQYPPGKPGRYSRHAAQSWCQQLSSCSPYDCHCWRWSLWGAQTRTSPLQTFHLTAQRSVFPSGQLLDQYTHLGNRVSFITWQQIRLEKVQIVIGPDHQCLQCGWG